MYVHTKFLTEMSAQQVVHGYATAVTPLWQLGLSMEVWEHIFYRLHDPSNLIITCKAFHTMSSQPSNKANWLRYQYGSWSKIFVSAAFQPFDITDVYLLDSSLECFTEFDETVCIYPNQMRLFRFMKDPTILVKMLNGTTIDEAMFTSGTTSTKPSRAGRRMFRFACWSGNVEVDLHHHPTNRKELAVGASYAIHSHSIKCLLSVLVRVPALEKFDHMAFREAIRTDQTHVAELLMDYYYRGVMKDRRELARGALIKAMGWVGSSLTLHYLLSSGASMLYFDWDFYAAKAIQRGRQSDGVNGVEVYGNLIPFGGFCGEAILAGATHNDIYFLDALLSLGLDLSEGGDDALQTAASLGNYEAVQWLLDHSVDPTYDDSSALRGDITARNNEAILRASANGYLSCVQACMQLGANIHQDRNAALRAACQANHVDVVDVLIDAGASPCEALGVSEGVATGMEVEVSAFARWLSWSLETTRSEPSWIERRSFTK
ncbi:hypothetical protein BC829DRAFT_396140 [Chytridium lagenaria]|nr:hypothetical protein BC829DRAFT_396140 [Chytridium lagenaria]